MSKKLHSKVQNTNTPIVKVDLQQYITFSSNLWINMIKLINQNYYNLMPSMICSLFCLLYSSSLKPLQVTLCNYDVMFRINLKLTNLLTIKLF